MNTADLKNKDLPAFACVAISNNDGYQQDGLTKREYFVGQILSGDIGGLANTADPKTCAMYAVALADAVLQELERGTAAK